MDNPVSFQADILPLFTETDIDHMSGMQIRLNDYTYMSDPANDHANARRVYDVVANKKMPPASSGEAPWSSDQVELFASWMTGGYQP